MHLKYARYIILHKWFVMLACFRRGLYWQGIVHDWSKMLPSEWVPYAQFFYGKKATDEERGRAMRQLGHDPYPSKYLLEKVRERFNVAWLKHQHRNPHHYQHWILRNDDGTTVALEMPFKYVMEMLSDWDGAGRAITGKSGGTPVWYAKNHDRIVLHEKTREFVDKELNYRRTLATCT